MNTTEDQVLTKANGKAYFFPQPDRPDRLLCAWPWLMESLNGQSLAHARCAGQKHAVRLQRCQRNSSHLRRHSNGGRQRLFFERESVCPMFDLQYASRARAQPNARGWNEVFL